MRLLSIILTALLAASSPHDIASLNQWGPYSKEYYGISHIDDLDSGIKVEFTLIPGQYRRNFKVPCELYETDVHPWKVSPDMKHICFRHEIEWKDRVYVDATYHILDEHHVLLETKCVNNTGIVQNINLQVAVRKSGGAKKEWTPEITQSDNFMLVQYPGIESCYGLAWDYPLSEVRQFQTSKLEALAPYKAHDHVYKNFKGDKNGHFTANFLRPVTLAPKNDTTILQMIVCGKKDEIIDELAQYSSKSIAIPAFPEDNSASLPQAGNFAFGEQLVEATLQTNVVYPIDAYGLPIRHFCPGKLWNSLYTWDCGFIAWAMSYINAGRGYEMIRQYTTSPEEQAPFVHHGTPLATQIFAIGDVWMENGCDKEMLREIYPRLKRFYSNMTGPDYAKKSGLLSTWSLFYNSGGWDDYCPQLYLRGHKELRSRTAPMVSTSYYIRGAKILRMMARELGLKNDIKSYTSDINRMGKAIQAYAWDSDCGYFSYVVHDSTGVAKEQLRTEEGANFNMGLDGVTPLVAGITTADQTARLMEHIFTKGELWTDCGITTVDQRAPYYRIDGYWNGTVWIPHQMILWKTMLDLGEADKARQIAFKALEKWNEECSDSYNCYEHFVVESGRGGGWFNFSGLSSPLVNWYHAYFKPGTLSTGFNLMATRVQWNEDKTGLKARIASEADAVGKKGTIIVCLAPGCKYNVAINGKAVQCATPYDGLIEIEVQYSKKDIEITIEK